MPYIISSLVFIVVSLMLIPSKWFEANVVKKRMSGTPRMRVVSTTKNKSVIKRITPFVINTMTMLNIRFSPQKREKLEKNIQLAGKESSLIVEDLISIKVLSAFLLGSYLIFVGLAASNLFMFLMAVPTAALTYFMPDIWLKERIKDRKAQIRKELPYTLNAMSIMSEAGLNLIPAMREVAAKQEGELAKELKKVVHDVSAGYSQVKALERMAERCQVDEVNRFISAVAQNIERGSSGVTKVLRQQAGELWEERKKRAQQLGEQAALKLFFPLLLLAFPATAIFVLGPAVISIIDFFLTNQP